MSQGLITDTYLSNLADAIRSKLGVEDTYLPSEMADAIRSIGGVTPEIVPWSTGTDEQIVALLQAAHEGTIDLQQDAGWAVGDVRLITIDSFVGTGDVSVSSQQIDIVITSFDEYMSCGNVMQFDFKDAINPRMKLSTSKTNAGGWGSSVMKTTVLPNLVNALPQWLQDSLIEFSCLASAGSRSSTINTVTGNKLALRSQVEMDGSASMSYSGEGSFLPYYQTVANRSKPTGHGGEANYYTWTRSPYNGDGGSFVAVGRNGSAAPYANDYSVVAPFGCL